MSVGSVLKLASDGVQALAPIVSVAGRAVSALGDTGVTGQISQAAQSAELDSLIERQMATSVELQQFSTLSNIEKSKHEARMAIISNIRSR